MYIVAYFVFLVIIVFLVIALMRLSAKVEVQEDDLIQRDKDIAALRNSLDCAHAINDKAQIDLSNARKLYGRTLREKHKMTDERDVARQMLEIVLDEMVKDDLKKEPQPSTT